LYASGYTGGPPNIGSGAVVEWGHVVVPDCMGWACSGTPTFALLGIDLVGLIGYGWRHTAGASDLGTLGNKACSCCSTWLCHRDVAAI
jgi:hypothetical protein